MPLPRAEPGVGNPSDAAVDESVARAARAYAAGRAREAEEELERALAAAPTHCKALCLLGLILSEDGRYGQSVAVLRRAVQSDPDFPSTHSLLGTSLLGAGEAEEAAACFERVIASRPADPRAWSNLGEAQRRLGRAPEAEANLRRAIALDAQHGAAWYNLGTLLSDTAREVEAVDCLTRAAQLRPGDAGTHSNLGGALLVLGRAGEAVAAFRRAVELAPRNAGYHTHLAYALLAAGRLEEGWREHEWRFGSGRTLVQRGFSLPHWQGEDLAGRSVLVWMEQGIGDELFFAGLVPEIAARAARCVVECAPKLVPLFARSFPGVEVVPRTDPPDPRVLAAFDLQVAAGNAPRWLRPALESFPDRAGYLTPDPERVAYWRGRLAALVPGLKVGFSWRSGNLQGARAFGFTRIEQWGPILGIPGVTFVSLQYGDCAGDLDHARAELGVELHAFAEVDLFNDLDAAAALTRALDLVVTAPSAVSRLSAALGVETWQMGYGLDWRTLGTDRTPWHPLLLRFDRASGQSWEEIIAAVAARLAARTGAVQGRQG